MFSLSHRLTSCLLATTAIAVLAGCSSNQQVSFNSGGVTNTISQGQGSVPKDFPLPIYPHSQAAGSVSAQGQKDNDGARFLMLSTSDSVDTVSQYYKKQLTDDGWKVDDVQPMGQMTNISAQKQGLDASVMISEDGKKTSISLEVSNPGALPDATTTAAPTDKNAPVATD